MAKIVYELEGKTYTTKQSDDTLCINEIKEAVGCGNRKSLYLVPEQPVKLRTIREEVRFEFRETDCIFLNGYQSWTACAETGIHARNTDLLVCPKALNDKYAFDRYGDASFYRESRKPGVTHGYTYGYIRRGERFILVASLGERSGFTRIVFDCAHNCIVLEKDCDGRVLTDGYSGLDYVILTGSEETVFDTWFDLMGVKPLTNRPVSGYTSWYNYYQDISETVILRDLEGLGKLPDRPEVFQIGDGFETFVGDWLSVDAQKFPNGLQPVAQKIREAGYCPGLWLAPFVAEKNSVLVKEHPDWLVYDGSEPLVAGGNWSGIYVLDFAKEEVRDYIRECVRVVRDEWGFSLLKLDFLYAVCLQPTGEKTRGEIMEEAMQFLREVCGSAQILACGVPLAAAFGKVEYCRIGADVSLEWDGPVYLRPFHKERPSTRNTMKNTVFRRQLSGRAFLNDPDVFILRTEHVSMTKEQKLALGTVNGLFGGVLFASDDYSTYTEEQMEWYRYFEDLRAAELLAVESRGREVIVRYRMNEEEKILVFA